MNSKVIIYAAGCKYCRTSDQYLNSIISREEMPVLSRSFLMEEIDPHEMCCLNCGEKGGISILFFKIDDLYYDMQFPPRNGFISLEAEKSNGQIKNGRLIPTVNGFGSYDCLNTLNIIQKRLEYFHSNWLSNQNINPNNFQSLPDGVFSFGTKLMDQPPYITTQGYFSRGFSFEDMKKLIGKLRIEITDDLNGNYMLY